jgi:hypothetical protein
MKQAFRTVLFLLGDGWIRLGGLKTYGTYGTTLITRYEICDLTRNIRDFCNTWNHYPKISLIYSVPVLPPDWSHSLMTSQQPYAVLPTPINF